MYRYYFRKSESGFHDWCERIYYCKELISDYYHFSDDILKKTYIVYYDETGDDGNNTKSSDTFLLTAVYSGLIHI